MADGDSHAFFIVIFLFVFSILLMVSVYFNTLFFSVFPNIAPQNATAAATYNTLFTSVKSIGISGFTAANYFIVIACIFALIMDVYVSYREPDAVKGIFNIMMLFGIPLIYLVLRISASSLNFLTVGADVQPVAFIFFSSLYFIGVVEFLLALSAIMCFRHPEPKFGQDGLGYAGIDSDMRSRA